jgi:hypothetical protein
MREDAIWREVTPPDERTIRDVTELTGIRGVHRWNMGSTTETVQQVFHST